MRVLGFWMFLRSHVSTCYLFLGGAYRRCAFGRSWVQEVEVHVCWGLARCNRFRSVLWGFRKCRLHWVLGLGMVGLRVIGRFPCQLRALAFVVISTSQKMYILSEHNITQAFIINVLTCNTPRRCEVVGNSYARGLQLLKVWFESQAAASHNPRGSKPINRSGNIHKSIWFHRPHNAECPDFQ